MTKQELLKKKWAQIVQRVKTHMNKYPHVRVSFPESPTFLCRKTENDGISGGSRLKTKKRECTLHFNHHVEEDGVFVLDAIFVEFGNANISIGEGDNKATVHIGRLDDSDPELGVDEEKVMLHIGRLDDSDPELRAALTNAVNAIELGEHSTATIESILDLIVPALSA